VETDRYGEGSRRSFATFIVNMPCLSVAAGGMLPMVCNRSQEIQTCVLLLYIRNEVLKARPNEEI
jgi:hypothetical protein